MEEQFIKAEEFLNKQPLLRLRALDKIESDSTENLVLNVLKYSKTRITVPAIDPETTQCTPGRRRSIGDIYNICRFYKPDVSLKEIQESLLSLLLKEKIWTLICPDINKRVWRYEPGEYHSYFQGVPIDEYKLPYDLSSVKETTKVNLSMLSENENYLRFLL